MVSLNDLLIVGMQTPFEGMIDGAPTMPVFMTQEGAYLATHYALCYDNKNVQGPLSTLPEVNALAEEGRIGIFETPLPAHEEHWLYLSEGGVMQRHCDDKRNTGELTTSYHLYAREVLQLFMKASFMYPSAVQAIKTLRAQEGTVKELSRKTGASVRTIQLYQNVDLENQDVKKTGVTPETTCRLWFKDERILDFARDCTEQVLESVGGRRKMLRTLSVSMRTGQYRLKDLGL